MTILKNVCIDCFQIECFFQCMYKKYLNMTFLDCIIKFHIMLVNHNSRTLISSKIEVYMYTNDYYIQTGNKGLLHTHLQHVSIEASGL